MLLEKRARVAVGWSLMSNFLEKTETRPEVRLGGGSIEVYYITKRKEVRCMREGLGDERRRELVLPPRVLRLDLYKAEIRQLVHLLVR